MRCRTCDYVLWNLQARECPECGDRFAPSDYDFTPNTVKFCCPHCDQHYFGTSVKGHLVPEAFTCISCEEPVTMDEMILRAAEGQTDRSTTAETNPWIHRQGSFFKAWMRTVGMSLVSPGRLMRGTSITSGQMPAWLFMALNITVGNLIAFLPVCGFMMLMSSSMTQPGQGPTAAQLGAGMGLGFGAFAILSIVANLIGTLIMGVVTHGLLRLGDPIPHGVGRTMQCWAYSSGPAILNAIPCVGSYIAPIWWLVSAVLAVRAGQRVSGARASFTVLTMPIILIILGIVAYILLVAWTFSMAATANPAAMVNNQASSFASAIIIKSDVNTGAGPAHAAQLMIDDSVFATDYISNTSPTTLDDIPIGDVTMAHLDMAMPAERRDIVNDAIDAMPPNVIAHRVGDVVFTYHGIDLNNPPDPGLWLLVMSHDPDTTNVVLNRVVVGNVNGTTQVLWGGWPQAIADQNTLRALHGLPPLPDPSTVTHDLPAVSLPTDDE